jgi:hypothetical protein
LTFPRGLAALILTLLFSTTLAAEYLYKDEVITVGNLPGDANVSDERVGNFVKQIEEMGAELQAKSGISLYLVVIKELPDGQSIVDYEKELAASVTGDAVFLTFAEFDKQVDIYARPESLYKYFDKDQILSIMPNRGTIIPLLVAKTKDVPMREKYEAALANGYADIAEQIASSQNIVLEHAVGSGTKDFINLLRLFFYGMIAYALFLIIKRKYFSRKRIDE